MSGVGFLKSKGPAVINQKELKELISYDLDTGKFSWLVSRGTVRKGATAGSLGGRGYILIQLQNKSYLAHRLAWLYVTGRDPFQQIDHINHDRTDNRIKNLREVSALENRKNSKKSTNNTSGHPGVYWCKQKKKWRARITVNGQDHNLGRFTEINDARNAVDAAKEKYRFHKNHGN